MMYFFENFFSATNFFVLIMQICPFLSLGMLLIVHPFDGVRLPGGNLLPRNNFRHGLHKILKAKDCSCGNFNVRDMRACTCLKAEEKRRLRFIRLLIQEGIPFYKINTHSWRKGSGSAAASGSTIAPPIVTICIRAGWKMHAMLERYLTLENAGDFFLGRVVAGLPQDHAEFAVLPPRFKSDLTDEQQDLLTEVYDGCFPNDTRHGIGMRAVCKKLLANIAWHKNYLQALPDTHPFRATWLSMNVDKFNALHEMVELKYHGDDLSCRFSATFFPSYFFFSATNFARTHRAQGIPAWIQLTVKVDRNGEAIKKMRKEQKKMRKELPKEICEKVCDDVGELIDRKGLAAGNLTHDHLDERLDAAFHRMLAHYGIRGPRDDDPQPEPEIADDSGEERDEREEMMHRFELLEWGDGKYHRLPEDYVLSRRAQINKKNPLLSTAAIRRTPLQAYTMWHAEDGVRNLPPLKYCDPHDFSLVNQKKRFNEWSQVCRHFDKVYLQKYAPEYEGVRLPRKPTGAEILAQFERAIEIHYHMVTVFHPKKIIREKRRNGDVSKKLSTIYTEIRLMRKKVVKGKRMFAYVLFRMALISFQKRVRQKLQWLRTQREGWNGI